VTERSSVFCLSLPNEIDLECLWILIEQVREVKKAGEKNCLPGSFINNSLSICYRIARNQFSVKSLSLVSENSLFRFGGRI
jgi:hypothetical protein